LVKTEGEVCWISLNRPEKLNNMNLDMHEMNREAMDEAKVDESVGCVVITGIGRAFCAGADVTKLSKFSPEDGKFFHEGAGDHY